MRSHGTLSPSFLPPGELRAVRTPSNRDFGRLISARRELRLAALGDLEEPQVLCREGMAAAANLGGLSLMVEACALMPMVEVGRNVLT
jgi:hypothetical protein